MDWIIDLGIWASLLTLTALEIVLGIDNLVFIAILAGRLPAEQQNRARQTGLALALLTRLALLASITWIIGLTQPFFEVFGHTVSWRDIVLVAGGLFLLYKGTREIHHSLEADEPEGEEEPAKRRTSFAGAVTQIMVLDVVFSLDSVITAVGMANTLWVMATAIVIAVMIMLVASAPLAEFVQRYPTVKMLALSFLMLIGMTLDRRRRRVPRPQGVYLRRDRLLCGRRGVEPSCCASPQAAPRGPPHFGKSGAAEAPPTRLTASLSADDCPLDDGACFRQRLATGGSIRQEGLGLGQFRAVAVGARQGDELLVGLTRLCRVAGPLWPPARSRGCCGSGCARRARIARIPSAPRPDH